MNWGAFFSAFGLVFVAELGDKTQLAVVTQTCKHRRPWAVFAGASAALIAVTALGVVGGQLLGRALPQGVLRVAAGAAFVAMGLLLAREALGTTVGPLSEGACDKGCPDGGENTCDRRRDAGSVVGWSWSVFGAAFGLLFLAELGDKTQLAVLSLSTKRGDPLAVLAGGALALTAVTAVGVIGGRLLCDLLPQRLLLGISAAAFLVMGVLMGIGAL